MAFVRKGFVWPLSGRFTWLLSNMGRDSFGFHLGDSLGFSPSLERGGDSLGFRLMPDKPVGQPITCHLAASHISGRALVVLDHHLVQRHQLPRLVRSVYLMYYVVYCSVQCVPTLSMEQRGCVCMYMEHGGIIIAGF